ncbi:hypothetical protein LguiB_026837 [Lonicera macranthoides]
MHFRFPEAPRHSFEQGWDYEGSQRKGSIYKGRERRFKLEFKSYIFKINNGGTTATIVEEIRKQMYSVCIDFGGINWLINDLKAAKQQYDNKRFSINSAMSATGARLKELALDKHVQCHKNYNLSPIQPDKAVFWCDNECEAENLAKKGILEINGRLSFKMQSGDQAQAVSTKKLSCTGGWIEISDLLLKWWSMEVFKAIEYECGGLVEIDHKTLNFEQIFQCKN